MSSKLGIPIICIDAIHGVTYQEIAHYFHKKLDLLLPGMWNIKVMGEVTPETRASGIPWNFSRF